MHMSDSPVTFLNPPLQETALSVQFSSLSKLTSARIGAFWWDSLSDTYSEVEDATPIEPQFERFGKDKSFAPKGLRFRIAGEATRIRATSDDRMVQLQNDRLVVNWLRGYGNAYPRFSKTSEELQRVLSLLDTFCQTNSLGTIVLNQWEVTYVNKIPQNEFWETPSDLADLLPGLLSKWTSPGSFESVEGAWKSELPGQTGRLHINLSHGWEIANSEAPQQLVLQFTARGPIDVKEGGLVNGMNIGHKAVVDTFVSVTSRAAQKLWGRVS